MKALGLLLLAAVATASTVHDGDIFEKYDVKKILETDELKIAYGCLMDRNPCGEYQLIRDRGPNILRTGCADCTPEQRDIFERVLKQFEAEHNDDYKKMMARYAPLKY